MGQIRDVWGKEGTLWDKEGTSGAKKGRLE